MLLSLGGILYLDLVSLLATNYLGLNKVIGAAGEYSRGEECKSRTPTDRSSSSSLPDRSHYDFSLWRRPRHVQHGHRESLSVDLVPNFE